MRVSWNLIPASSVSFGPHIENYNLIDYGTRKLLYYSIKSRHNKKQDLSSSTFELVLLSALNARTQRAAWLVPYFPQVLALKSPLHESLNTKVNIITAPPSPPHHSLNYFSHSLYTWWFICCIYAPWGQSSILVFVYCGILSN